MNKKSIFLSFSVFLLGVFSAPSSVGAGGPTLNPYQGSTGGSQYSRYTDVRRSRFCRFMRPSRCRTLDGFNRYLRAGCINDTDRESKCLQTFCGTNCAAITGCPTPGSATANACNEHCRFVNLNNQAAQNRLGQCVQGAYSADQAARKAAGRTYDRAQLRAVRSQERGSAREARRLISQLQQISRKRDRLFLYSGRPRSLSIRKFATIIDDAILYTGNIRSIFVTLERSGHGGEFIKKARAIINASDLVAQQFVTDVGYLYNNTQKLQGALRGETTEASASDYAPPLPPRRGTIVRNDGYANVPGFDRRSLPPSYVE